MAEVANGVRDIVAVCALPPPINGQTLANVFYSRWLKSLGHAVVLDLVPGKRTAKRIFEIARAAKTAFSLMPGAIFYTVPNAGRGMLITKVLVELAALRGARIVLHHHAFNYLAKSHLSYRSLFRRHNAIITHVF